LPNPQAVHDSTAYINKAYLNRIRISPCKWDIYSILPVQFHHTNATVYTVTKQTAASAPIPL
jgi:hypothetical protein